jgi:hypothetical protein
MGAIWSSAFGKVFRAVNDEVCAATTLVDRRAASDFFSMKLIKQVRRAGRIANEEVCAALDSGGSGLLERVRRHGSLANSGVCAAMDLNDECSARGFRGLDSTERAQRDGHFSNSSVWAAKDLFDRCGARGLRTARTLAEMRPHACVVRVDIKGTGSLEIETSSYELLAQTPGGGSFTNNEWGAAADLVDACRVLGFAGRERLERTQRDGPLVRVAESGVDAPEMEASSFALRCERSSRDHSVASAQSEFALRYRDVSVKGTLRASGGSLPSAPPLRDVSAELWDCAVLVLYRDVFVMLPPRDWFASSRLPLQFGDEGAGASAKGKANCVPGTDAIDDGDNSLALRENWGISRARRRGPGRDVPPAGENIGASGGVSGEESGNKSGECSASEGGSKLSALPARRQSRIQRANLASTSASAHLSMISCACFRRIARRFKCESSNDSRAGFEAVIRNSSCGWTGAMTIPPYCGPQREGGIVPLI